ncbi:hypothetical protein HQ36_01790 [Porphyromonas gingivicanis]|uniref:Uncharacterized protein n=1 Tax=Porphyromonas gingivicanis TaxID=266762 RepID=A0A0A2G9V4_9PORP|nr:hypothetical protein HQ36_01790 [Porphyromonas gingivicanis]
MINTPFFVSYKLIHRPFKRRLRKFHFQSKQEASQQDIYTHIYKKNYIHLQTEGHGYSSLYVEFSVG